MKHRFNFRQLLPIALVSALATMVYALYRLFFPKPLRTEHINITGANASTGELVLKDDFNKPAKIFKVKAGKTIQWLVNTSDVTDINDIDKKTSSENVFIEGPQRIGSSRNWQGTIDSGAANKEEEYYIKWTDKHGHPQTFDPYIQVKP
jgi:hypothetical protein